MRPYAVFRAAVSLTGTKQLPKPPFPLTALAALILATAASAQEDASGSESDRQWTLCPAPPPAVVLPAERQPGVTYVQAGRLRSSGEQINVFSGGVEVVRDDQLLTGEEVIYNQRTDVLTVIGDVGYRTLDLQLDGVRAEMRLERDSGVVHDADFYLPAAHGFGHAELVDIITPEFTELGTVTYSTCPPGQKDWQLNAERLALDEATNTGEAWNVSVAFMGVPFVYTPYLNFPLSGRKSGLLAPSIGSSDTNGFELAVPYYWNIAPNRDATITPHYIEERGAMLYGEFRYLFPTGAGEISGEYLPDDALFGDDRSSLAFSHRQNLTENWRLNALYNSVSDDNYFFDLATSQSLTSQTQLERRLDLVYLGSNWRFRGRVQNYQVLNRSPQYERMPQLLLQTARPIGEGAFEYGWYSEYVRFDHESASKVIGQRVDLAPALMLPYERAAGFLTPRLTLRHTEYDLERTAADTTPTRTLPVFSLDSGLFFERDLAIGANRYIQTLEPRLFYLYVPYEDQSQLPLFDTRAYSMSFAQLFRENRFTGADRVGDANQISAAVSTRFLDAASGKELASAGIGQIFYFRDRRVGLNPGSPVATRDYSNLVGELRSRPTDALDLSATTVWDPDTNDTETLTSRVRYRPGPRQSVVFSYREREKATRLQSRQMTDLAFFWPVSTHWNVLGRWNYDLENEQDLDTVLGFEYQNCCWSLRLVGRSILKSTLRGGRVIDSDTENSIMIQLELKGLTRVGRGLDDEIERDILGLE